ncbi:DUF3427 domain-containing protein [Kineococcus gynurae]|uniref:DUF3427 domain-containing protein n=1 Tax=Kineococcus gynurae TaxID=452979 RepID=A0ABV5LX06_9ACTN
MSDALPPGAYEELLTRRVASLLDGSELRAELAEVGSAAAPDVLARHVAAATRRVLGGVDPARRAEVVNRMLDALGADTQDLVDGAVTGTVREVRALRRNGLGQDWPHSRPVTPLSEVSLLTNGHGEPGLGSELRGELASADSVDLLCAFVRWYGLSVIEAPLTELAERGVPFRVITTTYCGATERRALDELVRRFGARVKVRYEAQSTKLHAKAWLFRRGSGFDTGYVGSSNLSRSALVDGLEWNVRISAVSTPTLVRKFEATFDTYWNDRAFTDYDPDRDGDQLDRALVEQGGGPRTTLVVPVSGLDVEPRPHQVEILEALERERVVHDRHRNLVVAATGTGKTVVAALDYRRLRDETSEAAGGPPTLLFVAHRREILEQALRTYREVLKDGSFGELHVGDQRASRWRHVFASVQSFSVSRLAELSPTRFDVVVVDEFHHAEAGSYRRVLNHLRPRELLGLTATPERTDGVDVREFFDGRTAHELRLWTALEADLLCPFHYFGVNDETDLTRVAFERGAYDVAGLSAVYTGNDARTRLILEQLRHRVPDVTLMRALGFCVSVDHAEYMARMFTEAGIPSRAVHGSTPAADRRRAFDDLRSGEVRCLFAVDLLNEGVDVPDVDTLLLLRPTQSATVFLQQLGRGLRRAPGKAVLIVLDFIGQHRAEYRFDVRYRALTGTSRTQLERQVEAGFPYLPPGSQLVLDPVSRARVLDNIRRSLRLAKRELLTDVRSYVVDGAAPTLQDYLDAAGREVGDVYRKKGTYGGWIPLLREAGAPTPSGGPDEDQLLKKVSALVHVDDADRARVYARLAGPDAPAYDELDDRDRRLARMLFFLLWPNRGGFTAYEDGFTHLRRHPAVTREITELMAGAADRARHIPRPLGGRLDAFPLLSHATYRREEILAALDYGNLGRGVANHVGGVAWCPGAATDALLINLVKDERAFSPTTMYRDYAISSTLFHWESQNATAPETLTGERYRQHEAQGSSVVLFTRGAPTGEFGTEPFACLGAARYVEHRGERPMAITWQLERAMPADVLRAASAAAA